MKKRYLGYTILGLATIVFCIQQILSEQVSSWPVVFSLFPFWLYGFFLCFLGWIKYKDYDLKQWILHKPVRFYYLGIILSVSVIAYFDLFYLLLPEDFIHFKRYDNILVESHGLLFDLLLFGIGIAIYDEIRSKKMNKERYHEELNDYRGWKDSEAAFRVAGIVKRLAYEGVIDIDLSNLHIGRLPLDTIMECIERNVEYGCLSDANFKLKDLSNVTFQRKVKSERMILYNTTLNETDFKNLEMSGSFLASANGVKTDFRHATMDSVNMGGSTFSTSKFDSATMTSAFLNHATFDNCSFGTTNLSGASLIGVKFLNECYFVNVILDGAKVDRKTWDTYLVKNSAITSKYRLGDIAYHDEDGGYLDYYLVERQDNSFYFI